MTRPLDVGLAATKLRPPTLPGRLVPRSRLGDVLDAGLADRVRLVLASAPAGSGKSTLLASWLAGRAESSSWLQVEGNDSDPARFWAYLVEALKYQKPSVVVIDPVSLLWDFDVDRHESKLRQSLDGLKLSAIKIMAVREVIAFW